MALRKVAALMTIGLLAAAAPATAGVKVSVKTTSYDIAGRTGAALLGAMDKRGPKHGFLTRAIAQTRYAVTWELEWGEARGACRLKRADARLDITYTYPRVEGGVPRDLGKRWQGFMAGVRKHEETHGSLARQMAKAAEKSITGLRTAGDTGCAKAKREVRRRLDGIYRDYEARQARFDTREHRSGGPVDRLLKGLLSR